MTTQNKVKEMDGAMNTLRNSRGAAFGVIIITALLAFEVFNYSTTDYALTDLLGNLTFMGIRWATILAIAFCGIDFAGIARLFAPEMSRAQHENWFLFGAWLLAATMNATLTWWGVSLAVLNHQTSGDVVIARDTMLRVAPIFVALLVWLIRVLIIGTFSVAGDHLFGGDQPQAAQIYQPVARPNQTQRVNTAPPIAAPRTPPASRPQVPAGRQPSVPAAPAPRPAAASRPAGTHSFGSQPRRYSPPVENDYSGGADEETDVEIIEPTYEPTYNAAPLAARSANRPSNVPAAASENNTSRNSSAPRRRF